MSYKRVAVVVLVIIALFAATAFAGGNKTKFNCDKKYCNTNTVLTDLLDIDKQTLKEKLSNGGSIYDMLMEANKFEEYKEYLLKDGKAKLDKFVKFGKFTQENADAKYNEYVTALDNWGGSANSNIIDQCGRIKLKFKNKK